MTSYDSDAFLLGYPGDIGQSPFIYRSHATKSVFFLKNNASISNGNELNVMLLLLGSSLLLIFTQSKT